MVNAASWPVAGPPQTMTMAMPWTPGTWDFDFGLDPNHVAAPRSIQSIEIACPTGSAIVDFLTVQDGSDVLPPAEDITIDWSDTDMPGGGYETTVVRSNTDASDFWMGSDVSGVAFDPGDGSWQQANGSGPNRFLRDSAYAVYDILPMNDGITLVMTKAGVMESDDDGMSWVLAEDGFTSGGDDDGVDISVDGRAHVCFDNAYGGGRYAVQNLDTLDVPSISAYVVSTAAAAEGLYVRGAGAVGAATYGPFASNLPPTVPTYIGAIEYIGPWDTRPATLVIGYRGDDPTLPALYTCDISVTPADCTAIAGSEGLDIRDIQIDTSSFYQDGFFVANGGVDDSCEDTNVESTIEEIVYDSSAGTWGWLDTVANTQSGAAGGVSNTGHGGITGLVMDTVGNYLFAVVFGGAGSAYYATTLSGLYRIPAGDIGTAAWQDLSGTAESDRDARNLNITNSDWWGEDQSPGVIARPYVADNTAADFIDGVFASDYTTLLLSGAGNMQRVTGMLDASGTFDAEDDTVWDFFPSADASRAGDFQSSTPARIAVTADGDLWQATTDLGLFYAASGYPAGLDCIFQSAGVGGMGVSTTSDGTTWLAGHQQGTGVNGSSSSVFRTTGYGFGEWSWCYQSGAWSSAFRTNGQHDDGSPSTQSGAIVCRYDMTAYFSDADDAYDGGARAAEPCDPENGDPGTVFEDGGNPWGNVADVIGVTSLVAIAKFQSTTGAGRLAYTLDGGGTWSEVDFGAMSGAPNNCNKFSFFANTHRIAAIGMDRTDHTIATADGADADADADSWSFDLAIPGDISAANTCPMALLKFSSTSPTPVWTNIPLTAAPQGCRLSADKLTGAVASPWRNLVYLYGGWGNVHWENYGGICSIDLATPLTPPEVVLAPCDGTDPADCNVASQFDGPVRAVYPDPNVADALFVAVGQVDDACRVGYPCEPPYPLLVERRETGGSWAWFASELESDNLQSLNGQDLVYQYAPTGGTLWYASAGTYKGQVSW